MNKAVYRTMRPFVLSAIIILCFSCSHSSNKPDVSDIKVNISVERFDKAFFALDTNQLQSGLSALNQQFPRFYPFFANDILLLNGYHQLTPQGVSLKPEAKAVIHNFLRGYRPVFDSLQKKYSNTGFLKEELETAFRYVKFYFPTYAVPGIVLYLGTFDAPGVVVTPKYIGIGLQQFAGKNFSAYQDYEIQQIYPQYISRRFDKEYMSANCMKAVVDDLYPDSAQGVALIEQMVEKGKQWWLLDKFLPDAPDSVKTGYTGEQLEWCRKNEGNIWGKFLSLNPDVFTADVDRVQTFLGEKPSTPELHPESPGNIGQWIGWKIVKKFAEDHPKLNLREVLNTAPRKIFNEAKYKPK